MPSLRLVAFLSMSAFSTSVATTGAAQVNPDTGVRGVCVSNCGSSSSSTRSSNGGLVGALIREIFRDRSDERRARGTEINNQAVQMERAGNLDEALRMYRRALELNGSPVTNRNIAGVLTQIAARDFRDARNRNDLAGIRGAEARLAEAESYNRPGGPDYAMISGWIAEVRNAIREALAYAAREAENARLLTAASGRISSITADISRSLSRESAASQARAQSLGFGDPMRGAPADASASTAPVQIVSTDPMVVDARGRGALPPGVPRLEEVENSPGREAWLRGMDAVLQRDWRLALPWFETALQRDPTNAALGRAVEIARWTLEHQNRPPPPPEPPGGRQPPATLGPTSQDREAARQLWTRLARLPPGTGVSDDFLFPPTEQAGVPELEDRAPLEGAAAQMFDAHLLGIARVIREAAADRQITAAERVRINDVRVSVAHALDEDARTRFQAGDVAGAVALLDRADQQWPHGTHYGRIRDALRASLQPAPAPAARRRQPTQTLTGLAPGATLPDPQRE